jgi:DNA polymerase-3 subunit beta
MNIEIPRSELLPALAVVSGVVERRQTLPILGNLLLSASEAELRIRATDLELEISTRVGADVEGAGEVTVPARKFVDICRALPEGARIKLRTEGERAILASGRSRFTLSTLPGADFPTLELGEAGLLLDLPSAVLKRLLEKTAFAMAQQDVRYYLNGVMLEFGSGPMIAVATDGHRLAKLTATVGSGGETLEESRQIILPAKSVLELRRLLPAEGDPIQVEVSERTLRVSFGDTVVVSKLVDGRYPDYERVIPKELPRKATVDKETLRAALQRAAILSNEKYKGVRVTFAPGTLGLQAHNPEKEQAEDEIEMDYQGDTVAIGFNVAYIVDVLQAVDREQVDVQFRDAESSAIWSGADTEDETFVIMPMRL